jgi:hypothetical protein
VGGGKGGTAVAELTGGAELEGGDAAGGSGGGDAASCEGGGDAGTGAAGRGFTASDGGSNSSVFGFASRLSSVES